MGETKLVPSAWVKLALGVDEVGLREAVMGSFRSIAILVSLRNLLDLGFVPLEVLRALAREDRRYALLLR